MQDSWNVVLAWCRERMGEVRVLSDRSNQHPGERTGALRIATPAGNCYLKLQRNPLFWENEVHAYRHWAGVFGNRAPKLLAVRDEPPLALVISELPGKPLERSALEPAQQREVWRAAGQALAGLHGLGTGDFFGPARRDGSPQGAPRRDALEHLTAEMEDWIERGERIKCLDADSLAVMRAACALLPAFAGERPTACHRDYCSPNWLVDESGNWAGVIDFEFAGWDVRSADFARYPDWEWMTRPDLEEAFFGGYGRVPGAQEVQQICFSRALYALGAIVWGEENDYRVFAAEGRRALRFLRERLIG